MSKPPASPWASFPKFRDLPQDIECLEVVRDYDEAIQRMLDRAKMLKYLGKTETHSIRLGYQWGEWEVILTDRTVFEEQGQPTKRRGKGGKR